MVYQDKENISLSKITPPLLSDIIPRKRLFRLMDTGRKCPILWIWGPPGSGKTTLAASYLKNRKLPCLWYRLDEGDDDAGSFFYYLSLAARKAASRNRRQLHSLSPENLLALPTFTRRYFQYLYARLKSPSAIVFDNYHEVPAGSLLHKVIHDGLAEVPSGINIIFTSRHDPPPPLADFRSRGMVEIISWNTLSLTIKETEAIVKTHGKGLKFSENAIDILHRRTCGWVAGLLLFLTDEPLMNAVLTKQDENPHPHLNPLPEGEEITLPFKGRDRVNENTLSLRERDRVRVGLFPGKQKKKPDHSSISIETPEVIFDYLAGEVFERGDDQTKIFLLQTAFLPGMTARMAEGLTGIPESRRILTCLHNNNLFIEKSSHSEPSYQYHPLFQEFLLSRAKALFTGDAIAVIQKDAARILESAGQVENALGLYIDAGDWRNAIRLICAQAPLLMAQGRGGTISTWLTRLPQEVINHTPWLLYWQGVLNLLTNQRESQSCFERAYNLFDVQRDAAGVYLSWCGVVNAIFHAFEDYSKFDQWIPLLDNLRAKYPAFPSEDIRARVTYTMFLALFYRNPMHPDFHTWAEDAIEIFHHDRDSCLRMEVAFHLVCYCHMVGDFARASIIIERLRGSAESLSEVVPLSLLGWKATEAFYSWLTGSPEECLKAVYEGLKVSEETGVHHLDYVLLGQGISGSLSSGNLPEARRLLKKMASSLERGRQNDRCFYHFVAAWEALVREDIPHALEHARSSLKGITKLGTSWQMFLSQLIMAQALHEKGEDKKADEYLSQSHQFASQSKSPFFEYMCHIASACFSLDRSHEPSMEPEITNDHENFPPIQGEGQGGDGFSHERSCLESLRKAMAIGKEKGIINFWGWHSDVMARLCAKVLDKGIEVGYVQKLIRERNLNMDPPPLHIDNWPYRLKIYTLGQFKVVRYGKLVEFTGKAQRKPLELLKVLIALGGMRVSTDRLCEDLWPDADTDPAYSSFTTTLMRLRRLIGNDAIQSRGKYITLDPRHCWVDVWAFEYLLNSLEKTDTQAPEFWQRLEKLLALHQGRFLHGEENLSNVLFFQNQLSSRFLGKIHKIGLKLEKAGAHEKAVALYQMSLEAEPLSEELYRYLMACYSLMDRHLEVRKVYQKCKKTIMSLSGEEPSRETEKLLQKLQARQE